MSKLQLLAENFNTKVYQRDDGILIVHAGKDSDTRETLIDNLEGMYPKNGRYFLFRVRERQGSFNSQWTGFIPSYNAPELS